MSLISWKMSLPLQKIFQNIVTPTSIIRGDRQSVLIGKLMTPLKISARYVKLLEMKKEGHENCCL